MKIVISDTARRQTLVMIDEVDQRQKMPFSASFSLSRLSIPLWRHECLELRQIGNFAKCIKTVVSRVRNWQDIDQGQMANVEVCLKQLIARIWTNHKWHSGKYWLEKPSSMRARICIDEATERVNLNKLNLNSIKFAYQNNLLKKTHHN